MIGWFGRAEVGPASMIVGSVLAATIGLTAIGGAQWIELRHVANAHRWIGWTALAWVVALPWSFLPGPAVDKSTPAVVHFALWSCAGALMAYTLAQVTWQARAGSSRETAKLQDSSAARARRGSTDTTRDHVHTDWTALECSSSSVRASATSEPSPDANATRERLRSTRRGRIRATLPPLLTIRRSVMRRAPCSGLESRAT